MCCCRKAKLFESLEKQKEKEKEEKYRKENYERKRSRFSEGKFPKEEEQDEVDRPKVRQRHLYVNLCTIHCLSFSVGFRRTLYFFRKKLDGLQIVLNETIFTIVNFRHVLLTNSSTVYVHSVMSIFRSPYVLYHSERQIPVVGKSRPSIKTP
jgi:hypothetical protein